MTASLSAGRRETGVPTRTSPQARATRPARVAPPARAADVDGAHEGDPAEVANSVLHDVGNVLNSVNVSAMRVGDHVRTSKAAGLRRLVTLLEGDAGDLNGFFGKDDRARQLPVYLGALAAQLERDEQRALAELSTLQKNIDHLKHIVSRQQSRARFGGITEQIDVAELVEDSLRLSDGVPSRHDVRVERDYQPVPAIIVDRHKVLQILVNLLRNAGHSCDASRHSHKLITLRIAAGGRGVAVSVTDNGVGIRPDHLARVFERGFTTKADGHGYGLHGSARTAQELGGVLSARSPGAGHGASFTLELPLQPPDIDRA